jgi:hypothetical protein
MAKKHADTIPIYVMRHGDTLVGEMNADRERIKEFTAGERIRVELRTGRIPSRLSFYWAFLREVVKATGCCPTEKTLHSLVKLKTGFTEDVLMGGYLIKVPASISFENMDEPTFGRFLDAAVEFIAAEFGITPEQVFGDREQGAAA